MQADISIINTGATTVEIGFTSDDQNDKAHGHVNGTDILPIRDFWGLPKKELVNIMKGVIKDAASSENIEVSESDDERIGGRTENVGGSRLENTLFIEE